MARTSFSPPEATIVVSTDGYFDVYPNSARADAVTAWSAVNGADALGGKLGGGRDGNESAA